MIRVRIEYLSVAGKALLYEAIGIRVFNGVALGLPWELEPGAHA